MPRTTAIPRGVHPTALRRINAIEVFNAVRTKPGLSQKDIVAETGIDRSTVSTIVAQFDALGLLERGTASSEGRRGRKSETLAIKTDAGLLIGAHIMPEQLLFVSSGLDGTPAETMALPPLTDAADVEAAIGKGLDTFLYRIGAKPEDVSAFGLCVPGLVATGGRLAESSNMSWQDLNLPEILGGKIPSKFHIDNDSRAAGIAEKLFGQCVDVDDYIYVDSASGLGGLLYMNGSPYVGAGGFAGEIGHMKVVPNGRLCTCGASGCASAYLSEPALVRRFQRVGLKAETFGEIRALAGSGSERALTLLDEAGEMLGLALSDLVNLFNPPVVVLGSGLGLLADYLLPAAQRTLARNALQSPRALCRIVSSDIAQMDTPRGGLALALNALTEPSGDSPFPW